MQANTDPNRFGTKAGTNFGNLLQGAQLGIGKQFGSRTFVAANSGLCRQRAPTQHGIFSQIGLKAEHQFGAGFGFSAAWEPPLTSLVCSQGIQPGLLNTPLQWGFDIFRVFRF